MFEIESHTVHIHVVCESLLHLQMVESLKHVNFYDNILDNSLFTTPFILLETYILYSFILSCFCKISITTVFHAGMYVCKVDGDMYSWHNLDGVYLIFTR